VRPVSLSNAAAYAPPGLPVVNAAEMELRRRNSEGPRYYAKGSVSKELSEIFVVDSWWYGIIAELKTIGHLFLVCWHMLTKFWIYLGDGGNLPLLALESLIHGRC